MTLCGWLIIIVQKYKINQFCQFLIGVNSSGEVLHTIFLLGFEIIKGIESKNAKKVMWYLRPINILRLEIGKKCYSILTKWAITAEALSFVKI